MVCTKCSVCGGDYVVKSKTKVHMAKYHVESREGYYSFDYYDALGAYRSTNKGIPNSRAYLEVHFDTDGTFEFEYYVICEAKNDYCCFGLGYDESSYYTVKPDSSSSRYTAVRKTSIRQVKAGDVFVFIYHKNGSVDYSDDQLLITIKGDYMYGMLSFDTQGGDPICPILIENKKPLEGYPSATYKGKFFDHWSKKKANGSYSSVNYNYETYEESTTLYAMYIDGITLTFDSNGGTPFSSIFFKKGTTPNIPTSYPVNGYYFLGWYTDKELTNKYTAKKENADFTLYAKWLPEEEAHPLNGYYDGVGQSGTSKAYYDKWFFISTDVLGKYNVSYSYSGSYSGNFGSVDEDGHVNVDNRVCHFDAARKIIIFIPIRDFTGSTAMYAYATNISAAFSVFNLTCLPSSSDAAAIRIIKFVYEGQPVYFVADSIKNAIYYDVTPVDAMGNPFDLANFVTSGEGQTQKIGFEDKKGNIHYYETDADGYYTPSPDLC